MFSFCPYCSRSLEPFGQVNRMFCSSCRCMFDVKITVELVEVYCTDDDFERITNKNSPIGLLPPGTIGGGGSE